MKTWKIFKFGSDTIAYVQVPDDCKIYDDAYASLQLVRMKLNDPYINGTQLLDTDCGEQMQKGIPVFVLE
jgi:hypothetical protein